MDAIAALEGEGRGFFTGSLGFVDTRGHAAFNILIRTLVWRRARAAAGEVSFHVGGGITWSSDAAAEERETLAKGAALAAALERPAEPARAQRAMSSFHAYPTSRRRRDPRAGRGRDLEPTTRASMLGLAVFETLLFEDGLRVRRRASTWRGSRTARARSGIAWPLAAAIPSARSRCTRTRSARATSRCA